MTTLPTDSDERKDIPMATGFLDYFPAAIAEAAKLSKVGNDKHNPGEPLHHARGKSMDHADTILRHLAERGTVDTDGIRHSVKVFWRAGALLQQELEDEEGAPLARGARLPVPAYHGPATRARERALSLAQLRGETQDYTPAFHSFDRYPPGMEPR